MIHKIDAASMTITVDAGVTLQQAQEAAEAQGLFIPLDLGSRGSATIGGVLAINAGGTRVLRWGMARNMALGLEVVLVDGSVATSLGKMIKDNAGYDWKHLMIGSEGTLGIITKAVLRLRPMPVTTQTALIGVETFDDCIRMLRRLEAGLGGQDDGPAAVHTGSAVSAALQRHLHRRDPSQGSGARRQARADHGSRDLERCATAACRKSAKPAMWQARLPSLLTGKIVDEEGEPVIATHAVKGKLRYRYYASRALQLGTSTKAEEMRIRASEIEAAVTGLLATSLDDVLRSPARAMWRSMLISCTMPSRHPRRQPQGSDSKIP